MQDLNELEMGEIHKESANHQTRLRGLQRRNSENVQLFSQHSKSLRSRYFALQKKKICGRSNRCRAQKKKHQKKRHYTNPLVIYIHIFIYTINMYVNVLNKIKLLKQITG